MNDLVQYDWRCQIDCRGEEHTVGVVTKLVNVETVLSGCQASNVGFNVGSSRLRILSEGDSTSDRGVSANNSNSLDHFDNRVKKCWKKSISERAIFIYAAAMLGCYVTDFGEIGVCLPVGHDESATILSTSGQLPLIPFPLYLLLKNVTHCYKEVGSNIRSYSYSSFDHQSIDNSSGPTLEKLLSFLLTYPNSLVW